MSWFDLGATLILVLAIVDGAVSGLVWALLETCLLVGSALAARTLAPHVEPYVLKVADLPPEDSGCASHVVVFSLTACMFFGVLILLHPASKRWRFRHDRWFGGVAGALNGVVASLILFAMALWSSPRPTYEDSLAESRMVGVLGTANTAGLSFLFPECLPERLTQLRRP